MHTFGTADLGAGGAASLDEVVVVVVVVVVAAGLATRGEAGALAEPAERIRGEAGDLAAALGIELAALGGTPVGAAFFTAAAAGLGATLPFSADSAGFAGADLAEGTAGLVVGLGMAEDLAATLVAAAGLAGTLDAIFAAGFKGLLTAAGLGGSAEFSSAFSFFSTSGSTAGVGVSLFSSICTSCPCSSAIIVVVFLYTDLPPFFDHHAQRMRKR